ncbi:hypothetical protein, partial [Speluncibacter jeojiensis]
CVKHAASVRPEPGSNSPLKTLDWPAKPAISQRHRVKSLAKKLKLAKTLTIPHGGVKRSATPTSKRCGMHQKKIWH